MIRVELIEEIDRRGTWRYEVAGHALGGRSRQPLLDACRQLKSLGVEGSARAGLFRAGSGREGPDLSCTVAVGAGLTVDETVTRFIKYRPYPDVRASQPEPH